MPHPAESNLPRRILLSQVSYRREIVILNDPNGRLAAARSRWPPSSIIFVCSPRSASPSSPCAICSIPSRPAGPPISPGAGTFSINKVLFTLTGINFVLAYRILPGIGVVALGHCGPGFLVGCSRHQRFVIRVGLALTLSRWFMSSGAFSVLYLPCLWFSRLKQDRHDRWVVICSDSDRP